MRYLFLTAVVASVTVTSIAAGATITQVGTQQNIGEAIRSTSVAKTLDLNLDNAYGTDGNEFFGVTATPNTGGGSGTTFENSASINLPTYVSDIAAVTGGLTRAAWDFGYQETDNPLSPIAATVANVDSGVAYLGSTSTGTEYPFFDIILASLSIPAKIRVGLFTDNEPGNQTATSFRIAGVGATTGNSLSMSTGTANNNMDGYFFDIADAQPNDVFRVYGVARVNGNIVISGITFDSVVPEPIALTPLAVLGLLLQRKRRV